MHPQVTAEGVARITWLAILLGIPCLLIAVGALAGIVVMLVRRK